MKKIILAALLCVFGISGSYAQHLKFMGIPLDGTITTFQQKLVAKGMKPDTELNKITDVGVRCFNGTFCGYKANIYVYYNPNTKTVYRAKAVITDKDQGIIDNRYSEMKNLIEAKYDYYCSKESTQEGHESYYYLVSSHPNDDCEYKLCDGTIDVYVTKFNEYPYWHSLHVDYTDKINDTLNDFHKMDDI